MAKKSSTPKKKKAVQSKAILADGIPVHCAHSKIVALSTLKPNPKNPNHHPEKQIKILAHIIGTGGWRQPITVSKRSGMIVRGHARLEAAVLLGAKAAPVDIQNYKSKAVEWADLIADNHIAELAELNRSELKDLLIEIDTGEVDTLLTGFVEKEMEALMTAVAPKDPPPPGKKSVTCPNCSHEFLPE